MKFTSLELLSLQIYKTNSDKKKYKGIYQVLLKPTPRIEMSDQELLKPLMPGQHLISVLMTLMD